uniref:Putative platelet-derived and vascular endothelial growth factors n=1 Tax=Anopheles braziliensis TaxID=58242 RepID=A0A2M3ZCD1_9DIPT
MQDKTVATVRLAAVLAMVVALVHGQQSADDRRHVGAIIFPDELNDRYERDKPANDGGGGGLAKEKRELAQTTASDGDYLDDDPPSVDAPADYDIGIARARFLSEIKSTADLIGQLDPDSIDARIFNDAGGEYTGRDMGENPKPASCEPQPELVSLRPENLTGTRYYYFPTCTRVNRCSGCCNTNQLVCEAVTTRKILYKVMIMEYRAGKKDRFSHLELVPTEEHVKCKCLCRIRESHCNELQVYNPNNCRCECTNREDRNQCVQERQLKQWNPDTCRCECLPRTEECTSGSHYDRSACKCLPVSDNR